MRTMRHVTMLADDSTTYLGEIKPDPQNPARSIWNGWIVDLYPDHITPGILVMGFYSDSKRGEVRYFHCSRLRMNSIKEVEPNG